RAGQTKTPEGTAESVASNPDASTRIVAFGPVAPSSKTYVTGWDRRCLARLSTGFEVRWDFRSTLSTGFPRTCSSTASVRLDLERPRLGVGQQRQPVGVDRIVREGVRRGRRGPDTAGGGDPHDRSPL